MVFAWLINVRQAENRKADGSIMRVGSGFARMRASALASSLRQSGPSRSTPSSGPSVSRVQTRGPINGVSRMCIREFGADWSRIAAVMTFYLKRSIRGATSGCHHLGHATCDALSLPKLPIQLRHEITIDQHVQHLHGFTRAIAPRVARAALDDDVARFEPHVSFIE